MLARVFARATCLSVRLSVTRRYCVKKKKASVMISAQSRLHFQAVVKCDPEVQSKLEWWGYRVVKMWNESFRYKAVMFRTVRRKWRSWQTDGI